MDTNDQPTIDQLIDQAYYLESILKVCYLALPEQMKGEFDPVAEARNVISFAAKEARKLGDTLSGLDSQ